MVSVFFFFNFLVGCQDNSMGERTVFSKNIAGISSFKGIKLNPSLYHSQNIT